MKKQLCRAVLVLALLGAMLGPVAINGTHNVADHDNSPAISYDTTVADDGNGGNNGNGNGGGGNGGGNDNGQPGPEFPGGTEQNVNWGS